MLKDQIQTFITERCLPVPGAILPLAKFTEAFLYGYLPPEAAQWTRRDVANALAELGVERGRTSAGQIALANLTMPVTRYAVRDGKLVRERLPH